jgi:predicted lipid-binding transport protein (Tim44 family)
MLDGPYQVVTLRIFANMLDMTVNERQEIIAGSDEQRRYCSEYWTFRRDASSKGPWVLSTIEQDDVYKNVV